LVAQHSACWYASVTRPGEATEDQSAEFLGQLDFSVPKRFT